MPLEAYMILVLPWFAVGIGLMVIPWYRLRRRLDWFEARSAALEEARETGASSDPRVEMLEGQVEAIHQQLDRLVAGQEFLSRVVVDRGDRLRTPSPRLAESITPH